MTIRFVEEAQREFLDAISRYEEARAGLGRQFKDEVDRSILWVAAHRELYRVRSDSHRRINLRVFPYYVAYVAREQTLWVLAIAHASGKPLYWISRRDEVA